MLGNYFTITRRNLIRHQAISFINIFGLSLGLASVLLIVLYVQDERLYDQHYLRASSIYRVSQEQRFDNSLQSLATTSGPLAQALHQAYPEVEQATRLHFRSNLLFSTAEKTINDQSVAFADANINELFDFSFLHGNPATALAGPNSLVLTQKTAYLLFARQNPMGKIVRFNNGESYLITGVIADLPTQSHFHFDALASLTTLEQKGEWLQNKFNNSVYTYLLLKPGSNEKALGEKLLSFGRQFRGDEVASYQLQALTDIHLHSHLAEEIEPNGNATFVYIFLGVAALILLLAGLNYVILAMAQYTKRLKEVGLRKTFGAGRSQLAMQFWIESLAVTSLGLMLGLLWVVMALPSFNALTGKDFSLRALIGLNQLGSLLLLVGLVSTLVSACPAWYVSRLALVEVLKGKAAVSRGGLGLRNGLIIFQFSISIALLIGSLVVYQQLEYIASKPLGFHREYILHVKVRNQPNRVGKMALFKQEIGSLPGILAITTSGSPLGEELFVSEVRLDNNTQKAAHALRILPVDYGYFQTMGLEMVSGRPFSEEFASDTTQAFIINEAAVRQFGWHSSQEAIGKELEYGGGDRFKEPIIGVVKDFHYASLHEKIQPLLLMCWPPRTTWVSVRLQPGNPALALLDLERSWRKVFPDFPFEYSFGDQVLARLYRNEEQVKTLLIVFSGLAVIIASLGLFALATFSAGQRTKEIGIRKVLGATVTSIVGLLTKDFLLLVLVANLIAWPLAWWTMHRWLEGFAYRISLSWEVFLLTGILAMVIALLTIAYRAFKAAQANPVESLRTK